MCLLFLSLLIAPRPAQAQGSWAGRPCDAQGNLLGDPPHNDGGYVLTGTQTGTLSNTYPVPLINAALNYPDLYGDYLYAGNPMGIGPLGPSPDAVTVTGTPSFPNDRIGAYTPGFADASNYGSRDEGSYSIDAAHGGPSSGSVNGSVAGDMKGQILCYFKMTWYGPSPAPDHADFLVSTYLYAQAQVDYPSSVTSGLSATATASDGDPFNETVSASAGDGASSGGVPEVDGYHLVRAAVDPQTMIAEVYLGGTAHWVVSNQVPYQTAGSATAVGGSFVRASAKQDNREVTLYREKSRLPGKVYSPDGQLHGEYVDASGVAHGETTYSTQTPNWQIFHPVFSDAWSQKTGYDDLGRPSGTVPDVTWAWSPNESEDTWCIGKCEMPNSSITYNDDGTSSGTAASSVTYPVTYTSRDNGDQAQAAASYALVVHEQWDNKRLDPSHPFDVFDTDNKVQYNGTDYPAIENDSSSQTITLPPLTFSTTATASLTSQLNGSFKVSDFVTLGGNFQPALTLAVQAGMSIPGPNLLPRNFIQLMFHVHYHRNHWLTDHYTTAGYDNTYLQIIDGDEKYISLHWGVQEPLADVGGK